MTFDQFKTICTLAEKLTDIQFGMITRQEMLDWCEEFYRECDNEDDHFYAILKDGRTADKEFEPCKKSDLRTAYKVTYTFPGGTLWFLSNEAKKDEQLFEDEVECEMMNLLWEYIDEDKDYSADELIDVLKQAIAEKDAA